jgi:hypothetical protein
MQTKWTNQLKVSGQKSHLDGSPKMID